MTKNHVLLLMSGIVCVAGAAVGGFFGYLSSELCDSHIAEIAGVLAGIGCGLLAGGIWSWRVIWRVMPAEDGLTPTSLRSGALWGGLVGIIATIVMYWILDQFGSNLTYEVVFLFSLMFGMPAGVLTGLLCALLCGFFPAHVFWYEPEKAAPPRATD